MIEYRNLKDRDELVARARRVKERLDVSTVDDLDEVLHDLLSGPWPTAAIGRLSRRAFRSASSSAGPP